jgi:L-ascorbate metabolism protein UlaG (beta-lactamase superfamily)
MAEESLQVTWYGQSMFRISGGGVDLVVDPVGPQSGYTFEPMPADVVLVTHDHGDHNYVEGIRGSPEVLRATGTFTLDGLHISGFPSFHDPEEGARRGPNVIYAWEQAGLRLAHLGDVGCEPDRVVVDNLKGLDLLMIPVGGVYTIDAVEAARMVRTLSPAVAFPMHYLTDDVLFPLEPLDGFTGAFPGKVRRIEERPAPVTRDMLPSSTEVWVLKYE